mmetsp:Transcript_39893/g.104523  ORF Transcript_39893/g.104523 Transcript_39893/m.104523 type:complete len:219 (-) Transcript_39893:291-947(-)
MPCPISSRCTSSSKHSTSCSTSTSSCSTSTSTITSSSCSTTTTTSSNSNSSSNNTNNNCSSSITNSLLWRCSSNIPLRHILTWCLHPGSPQSLHGSATVQAVFMPVITAHVRPCLVLVRCYPPGSPGRCVTAPRGHCPRRCSYSTSSVLRQGKGKTCPDSRRPTGQSGSRCRTSRLCLTPSGTARHPRSARSQPTVVGRGGSREPGATDRLSPGPGAS